MVVISKTVTLVLRSGIGDIPDKIIDLVMKLDNGDYAANYYTFTVIVN